jgi:hypothetical protein
VGDAQAIADALVSLMEDPNERRRLGFAGYRRVSEEFTWARAIDDIQALYDVVINLPAEIRYRSRQNCSQTSDRIRLLTAFYPR